MYRQHGTKGALAFGMRDVNAADLQPFERLE